MTTIVGTPTACFAITPTNIEQRNPCAGQPEAWDIDQADPATLISAAELCLECPILESCRSQAESGSTESMVWAGIVYDEDGCPVPLNVVRSWTRPRGIVNKPRWDHDRIAS